MTQDIRRGDLEAERRDLVKAIAELSGRHPAALSLLNARWREVDSLLNPPDGPARLRRIEVYVGESYGGDTGSWYVTDVRIPADTPEADIESAARAAWDSQHADSEQGKEVSFTGLYCAGGFICQKCDEEIGEGAGCGHESEHLRHDDCCVTYEVLGYHTRADFDAGNFVVIEPRLDTMAESAHAAKESLDHFAVTKAQSSDREEIELFGDKD